VAGKNGQRTTRQQEQKDIFIHVQI
jgi:hypothetical protein